MNQMDKSEIIDALVKQGVEKSTSTMYADAFLEYREATENIEKNGVIVQHPRTMNPIENPYLKIRDSASRKIRDFKLYRQAEFLWNE